MSHQALIKFDGKLAYMQHCIHTFVSKENAGKAIVGVAALRGASACHRLAGETKAKRPGEIDRARKLHDTREESKDVGREEA